MTGPLESAALAFAELGLPVLPCRGKIPATAHGFLDATCDQQQITHWWAADDFNVAIATGPGSIDVLDIDVRLDGDGYAALRRVIQAGYARGAQAIAATPSGGLHLWFTGTTQRCGRLPRHHLDFKSCGGYVLAPPSTISGTAYRFTDRREPGGTLDWAAVHALLDPARPGIAATSG